MSASTTPFIDVTLSGATGWAGSALARGIAKQADMRLVGAVGGKSAGRKLGELLGDPQIDVTVSASAAQALTPAAADTVFVEYSKPKDVTLVKANILAAIVAGAHVVVASSGLSDADYDEIDAAARAAQRGVLACGNFAITAVLLQRFAEIAAAYVPHFEIIDSAKDSKPDAPSGTGRELALRLSKVRQPEIGVPLDKVNGPPGVRGATVNGVQVHAVRLPGYVIGIEAIFGMPDQRLHIRHEAGAGAEPYVDGALLAIRKVGGLVGLTRGLDRVMDL
jgi:4-hydroxy-tetrahydrodipicolinate reductase